MEFGKIISKLQALNIPYEENVSLKHKTWIKTGGIVSLWIMPDSVESLIKCCRYFYSEEINFELVGHTSNIYYLDDYNPSIIITTVKLRKFVETKDFIECACGTPVTLLSRYCIEKGYKGYFGLVNLPGTVGGGNL